MKEILKKLVCIGAILLSLNNVFAQNTTQENVDFSKQNYSGWIRKHGNGSSAFVINNGGMPIPHNFEIIENYSYHALGLDLFSSPFVDSKGKRYFSSLGVPKKELPVNNLEYSFLVQKGRKYYISFVYRCIIGNSTNNCNGSANFRYTISVNGNSIESQEIGFCNLPSSTEREFKKFVIDDTPFERKFNRSGKVRRHENWVSVLYEIDPAKIPYNNSSITLSFRTSNSTRPDVDNFEFCKAFVDVVSGGGLGSDGSIPAPLAYGHCSADELILANDLAKKFSHTWEVFNPGGTRIYTTTNEVGNTFLTTPGDHNVYLTLNNTPYGTIRFLHAVVHVVRTIVGDIEVIGLTCGTPIDIQLKHNDINNPETIWTWSVDDGLSGKVDYDQPQPTIKIEHYGTYKFEIDFVGENFCRRTQNTSITIKKCPLPCGDCITDFSPSAGDYILSAWVKQVTSDNSIVKYTAPSIVVSAQGLVKVFKPEGEIIDGWQRIEGVFKLPNPELIQIDLKSIGAASYFDDIRLFPYDGSMISYVYDQKSLRLVAELDERNYAKFYEYDEEGKLIRVKKETEMGIRTIQETRENSAIISE